MNGETIVIGFGGNVGGEEQIVERFLRARDGLAQLGSVRAAALYRSTAIALAGTAPQPAFVNTAIAVRIPDIRPGELIATVLELERRCGRDRRGEQRWGPRAIDLDVLVWGARTIATPELAVPHPELHARRFALAPLVEVVGEAFEIPGVGPAGDALARVSDQIVELIAERW